MPSEKQPFYDPVPPTYDEALAAGGSRQGDWLPPRSSLDDGDPDETESRGLLGRQGGAVASSSSSRPPRGYRAPTVETDDEDDSLFGDDSEDDEAAQVRREMQEMDVEEPSQSRGDSWSKRIASSLSLPRWKWSWRPRLPTLPRMRIQLPSRPSVEENEGDNDGDEQSTETQTRLRWPKVDGMVAVIVIARTLAILIILGFIYVLFTSDLFGGINGQFGGGIRYNPEDLRVHIQNSVDPDRMREVVEHYSNYAHIAGTEGDYATAKDMESMLSKALLDEVVIDEYFVYLNYPRKDGRAVQIMDSNGKKPTWSAVLEEDEMGKETAGTQTLVFHGHSKSGDVKGPLIYANYGSKQDYQDLKDKGIDTEGAIALVRYYGTQTDRALKVKGAELAGFAGCLIYSDPADDGFLKGDVAPKGRYMPKDGVQRGAVSLMSWVVGDVLTPGWASLEDVPRMKIEDTPGLVKIPSLPLSWRDAQVLLQHLKGHGEKVKKSWKGGVPDVEWWTGNSSSPVVRLKNEQDEETKKSIWNVYGKIQGTEQGEKSIILGNHRDAWGFGATDPHTGTAIMVEIARIFGDLKERGWRPLRSIEFMSWDAEEYNLIGSTEFVENNIDTLRDDAFAYINLDTVVTGSNFKAAGSPVFAKSLLFALDRVMDPHQNSTLRDQWDQRDAQLDGLGAGSDFVAFQDIAGTSSLDLGFANEELDFPYHSSYDNFDMVSQHIDPDFSYHAMMAQVVGLLMLDLADRAILPFDMSAYARRLKGWVDDLEKWTHDQKGGGDLNFQGMKDAVELVKSNAFEFEKWELEWDHMLMQGGGWEAKDAGLARLDYNNRMAQFETLLLDLDGGIPNRTQFKHVVFGPQLWSGYDEAFFPAIRDIVEAKDWEQAKYFIDKTAYIIQEAAAALRIWR